MMFICIDCKRQKGVFCLIISVYNVKMAQYASCFVVFRYFLH